MRRTLRTSFIAGIGALTSALIIAAVCAALLVLIGVDNFQSTQQAAEKPAAVIASVETGSVEKFVSVQVHTSPSSSLEVPSTQFGSGIVTTAASGEGAVLNEGDVLFAVNEAPVMILHGASPAYRGIGQGAQGSDVRQLQDYLRTTGYSIFDEEGTFGRSTALALSELYGSRGYPMVDSGGALVSDWQQVGLPLSRYVFVASTPVLVGSQCGRVGQPADALQCVLSSQATTLAVSATSEQSLTGLMVTLQTNDGTDVSGTVGDLTAPLTDDATPESEESADEPERWYSLLDVPDEAQTKLLESAQVIVEATAAEGLRLPVTAVREWADGKTYVREASLDQPSPAPEVEHSVEVDLCAGGYCAVRGDDLFAGMKVVLLG